MQKQARVSGEDAHECCGVSSTGPLPDVYGLSRIVSCVSSHGLCAHEELRILVTIGREDNRLYVYDMDTGSLQRSLRANTSQIYHREGFSAVCFSPRDAHDATVLVGGGNVLSEFRIADGTWLRDVVRLSNFTRIKGVTCSHDTVVILAKWGVMVYDWAPEGVLQARQKLSGELGDATSACMLRNGTLAVGSDGYWGGIRLANVSSPHNDATSWKALKRKDVTRYNASVYVEAVIEDSAGNFIISAPYMIRGMADWIGTVSVLNRATGDLVHCYGPWSRGMSLAALPRTTGGFVMLVEAGLVFFRPLQLRMAWIRAVILFS